MSSKKNRPKFTQAQANSMVRKKSLNGSMKDIKQINKMIEDVR